MKHFLTLSKYGELLVRYVAEEESWYVEILGPHPSDEDCEGLESDGCRFFPASKTWVCPDKRNEVAHGCEVSWG